MTVCVPAFAGRLTTSTEFDNVVTAAAYELTALFVQRLPGRVQVVCNTRGSRTGPISGQYFTLSGLAVDYGGDGLVGRGNARTGVISGAHLAGNEAAFGKNPAYHVGKVGGWLADEAARTVAAEFGPCRIGLLWRNGARYDEPASVEIITRHTDEVPPMRGTPPAEQRPDGPDRAMTGTRGPPDNCPGNGPPRPCARAPPGPRPMAGLCTATRPTVGPRIR